MKIRILSLAILLCSFGSLFAQSDTLFNPYQVPGANVPTTVTDNGGEDNFLDMSANAGQVQAGAPQGGGIGNGRGGGFANSPNAPIDPGGDPGIPVDGGIAILLLAGGMLGVYQLFKAARPQAS